MTWQTETRGEIRNQDRIRGNPSRLIDSSTMDEQINKRTSPEWKKQMLQRAKQRTKTLFFDISSTYV